MAIKPVHTTKDVLAQKKRPSEQMTLINLRWQQMRLLELQEIIKPLPKHAANAEFDSVAKEESA
jgi:hypothetical protein